MSPQVDKAVGSFVAAAVGDALGWPFEGRSRRVQQKKSPQTTPLPREFVEWTRSGSRSEPYREPIRPGEYSDDTQLLLATARSLSRGAEWWDYFTSVELPAWLLYERGGGGATKRAAQLWLAGTAPWDSPRDREQYFQAGGNGVSMRILPHVIANRSANASELAQQIILNGICTHGHPRALIGGLLHGMTLWLASRQDGMLEFGALVDAVHREFCDWARLPELPPQWQAALPSTVVQTYKDLWDETVRETIRLVETAKEFLGLGPLSVGAETLQQMGALNPKTNGSGTISAAASLFLASRYAASPLQGVLVAATTLGADTDTLASMTGSILGAIHGEEWLGHFATSVQDAAYLRKTASGLVLDAQAAVTSPIHKVTKRENSDFVSSIKSLGVGGNLRFPDGRRVAVKQVTPMFSQTAKADLCLVETDDGQTMAVRRVVRRAKVAETLEKAPDVDRIEKILRVGIKLSVYDLAKAREFYVNKLRFPVDKEYSTGFTVAGIISIHLADRPPQGDLRFSAHAVPTAIPCIRVMNLSAIADRLSEAGIPIRPVREQRCYKAFQILDPFGNTLELFEA